MYMAFKNSNNNNNNHNWRPGWIGTGAFRGVSFPMANAIMEMDLGEFWGKRITSGCVELFVCEIVHKSNTM